MLSVLRVQNLAIVNELEVEFGPGLNVLTGETGAGKSIILKAIELLTGKRGTSELIRTGADKCIVEGLFIISKKREEQILQAHEEFSEYFAGEELLIRRTIDASGKTRILLNGQMATATVLQNLSSFLLDITGQHQQQTLLDSDRHRQLLDTFGVSEEILTTVAQAYREYAETKRKLDSFLKDQGARLEYFRRIGLERDELQKVSLKEGGREELEQELRKLASVETLTANVNQALLVLEGEEESIETRLRSLTLLLSQSTSLDPALQEILSLVETASVQLSEAGISLADYGSRLEADPDTLEDLRERISDIARLERKYVKSEGELLQYREKISQELSEFESGELDEKRLRDKCGALLKSLRVQEEQLTVSRKAAGEKLAQKVRQGLKQLNMKHADFLVAIAPGESSPHGSDVIEFLLAANPGEPARPLQKVASGGELSRILLILKTILNAKTAPGTQVFDEVDTGIGGAVAQIVGEKLQQVAKSAQVILVTHSPQIAAFADKHFVISKSVSGEKTSTKLGLLSEQGRVEHIAAMLAGKNVSQPFEQSARELLEASKRTKS